MKNSKPGRPTIVISVFLALCITSGICAAQEADRKGKFEFFGLLGGTDKIETDFSDINRSIKIDGGPGGGLGVGYNFNNNLNLNTSVFFSERDLERKTLSGTILVEGDIDVLIWEINLEYSLLQDNFTPILTAGLGSTDFDGKYDTGVAVGETDFSYNIGAGFRWDVSKKWFLKAIYKSNWVEIEDADDSSRFDGFSLSFGYKF